MPLGSTSAPALACLRVLPPPVPRRDQEGTQLTFKQLPPGLRLPGGVREVPSEGRGRGIRKRPFDGRTSPRARAGRGSVLLSLTASPRPRLGLGGREGAPSATREVTCPADWVTMSGMTTWQRKCWWGLALIGAGAGVGLLVWVTVSHPEGSAQGWGVVGAVAGLVAAGAALWQLRTSASSTPAPTAGPAPAPPTPVVAERGAIVARGNVTRSSTHYSGTSPAPSHPATPHAEGLAGRDGAIAAGGDIEDSTTEYRS
ncbi:hypothetical protein GCM10017562_75050 [Streptomyces roseofulvus]